MPICRSSWRSDVAEVVGDMPPMGTVNLHGSVVAAYRGAAPINWAVINGEKEGPA